MVETAFADTRFGTGGAGGAGGVGGAGEAGGADGAVRARGTGTATLATAAKERLVVDTKIGESD